MLLKRYTVTAAKGNGTIINYSCNKLGIIYSLIYFYDTFVLFFLSFGEQRKKSKETFLWLENNNISKQMLLKTSFLCIKGFRRQVTVITFFYEVPMIIWKGRWTLLWVKVGWGLRYYSPTSIINKHIQKYYQVYCKVAVNRSMTQLDFDSIDWLI